MTPPDDSNGACGTSPGPDTRSLGEHYRRIQRDAHALAGAVQDATSGLESYLTEQVQRRPCATLGVAAGVGYVLGGGLGSRLTPMLVGVATRVAMAVATRELGDRLSPPAPVHPRTS